MNHNDDITTGAIAELLGLNVTSLRACINDVPGFPGYRLRGHIRVYSRVAIVAWIAEIEADGGEPAELFREAYRRRQAAERYGETLQNPVVVQLRQDFIAGRFLTAEQKAAQTARRAQAAGRENRRRVIQRIRPDWF